jgi:uncharacterized protein (DUF58 family)
MATPDGDKWIVATQLAAAFAYLLLCSGNRVGLIQFSDGVDHFCQLGRGRLHYVHVVDSLQASAPRVAGGASALRKITSVLPGGTHVVVVSDFLQPDGMCGALGRLRRPGRAIEALQVLSPEETAIPQGVMHLRDVETGVQLSVSGSAESLATTALEQLCNRLKAFCASNAIRFSSSGSQQRWQDIVLAHLGYARV